MIKVQYKSTGGGELERKVRAKIGAIAMLWDELADFERLFELEMIRMPKKNHINARWAYRLKKIGNSIEVWHYSPKGDPDRLIAIIEDDNS